MVDSELQTALDGLRKELRELSRQVTYIALIVTPTGPPPGPETTEAWVPIRAYLRKRGYDLRAYDRIRDRLHFGNDHKPGLVRALRDPGTRKQKRLLAHRGDLERFLI